MRNLRMSALPRARLKVFSAPPTLSRRLRRMRLKWSGDDQIGERADGGWLYPGFHQGRDGGMDLVAAQPQLIAAPRRVDEHRQQKDR